MSDKIPNDTQELTSYIKLLVDIGVLQTNVTTLAGVVGELKSAMDKQDNLKPKDLEEFKLYIKETILGVQSNLQSQINDKASKADVNQLKIDLKEKANQSDVDTLVGILKWALGIFSTLVIGIITSLVVFYFTK